MVDILKFISFLFVFCFLPGQLALSYSRAKLSKLEDLVVASTLGIVILSLLSFILGYLRFRFLLLPLLLLADFYLLIFSKWRPKIELPSKKDWLSIFIIVFGGLTQAVLLLKSGSKFDHGLAFWGVHGYDGIWHASLIAEITRSFPPQNPGFAGYLLKNYHFLTDLFFAQIHYFSKVPILDLYFRFGPLFFTLLLNSAVYALALRWTGKKAVALLSIFFVSVAGSFGWILPFFGIGSDNWETAFWGIQTPSSFVNPPFGVSLIIIVVGLILLDCYFQKKEKILAGLLIITFGILAGFKIYGALVSLIALGLLGIWEIIKKKNFSFFLIAFLSSLISLVIYFRIGRDSAGFLIWKPWWFIRTMIEAPDRVNWVSLEMRRQAYYFFGDYFKILVIEIIALVIFIVGNLSARTLGFFFLLEKLKKGTILDKFFLFVLPITFLPPLFFIQKAVAWNTIQFLYYFSFFFSFLAAETTFKLLSFLKPRALKGIFLLILIGISLPSTVKTIWWYNAPTPTTLLAGEELEALNFLKKTSLKDDVILTYPYGEITIQSFPEPPAPMTYYNSPYVSFFSDRRVFLEDQNTANILGYPLEERLDKVRQFFQTKDPNQAKNFLAQGEIDYIYLVDEQKIILEEKLPLVKIFDNQKVRIFKVSDTI